MNLEKLENIGLTKGEIKVYEALLILGESTKTPIANKSGISPGKIYDVLNRLIKKGLVSVIKKENVQNFKAASPSQLKIFVEDKKEKIEQEERIVQDIMPILISKFKEHQKEENAEIYYGWKGLQTIYNEIIEELNKGDIDYAFGATKGENPSKTLDFFSKFNQRRYEKGIKLKIIYNLEDREFARKYLNNKKLDEIRYLELQTPAEINISKRKVVILILSENPLGIVIRSEKVANSFKQYFDKMWEIGK
ncbi:MAG: helix-turn-helix domain-containing protein [Nanoarchaeota archaeon]|nr:helix-turn-helix domain-containing protein [Nanoarchaeota archaeon]